MLSFDVTLDRKEVEKHLTNIQTKYLPKVIKKTIDKTIFQVKDAIEEEIERAFENPTKFTKKSIAYYKSHQTRLVAGIFIKDRQAEYLAIQITGGVRLPTGKSIITPSSSTKLNKHGNITRGKRKKLFSQANTSSSGKVSYFVGKPKNSTLPYGLYKTTKRKKGAKLSQQLGMYKSLKYKKQFQFYKVALKTAKKNIVKNFQRYMSEEGMI